MKQKLGLVLSLFSMIFISNVLCASEPRLSFDTQVYDFGKVIDGETVVYSFQFTNTGSVPVRLLEVRSSCGCTVAEYNRSVIEPNQFDEIQIEFDSTGRLGRTNKNVYVTYANSNDTSERNNIVLRITGEIEALIKVNPPFINFREITNGGTVTSSVELTLNRNAGSNFQINSINTEYDFITVSKRNISSRAIVLTVKLDQKAAIAHKKHQLEILGIRNPSTADLQISGTISIRTNIPTHPNIYIGFRGYVDD